MSGAAHTASTKAPAHRDTSLTGPAAVHDVEARSMRDHPARAAAAASIASWAANRPVLATSAPARLTTTFSPLLYLGRLLVGAAFPLHCGGRARSNDGAGGPELRGTSWNGAAGGLSLGRWSARRCSRQQDSPIPSRWPCWCSRMARAWRAAILRVERPPSRWFVSACRLPPPPRSSFGLQGVVQVMSPLAVVWYVRQIGAPPGFWAAPWRPRATCMPRRPLVSRPVRAGWTPFGSVGALRRDARSYIFRRRGPGVDSPAQYGPRCECKTALTPATAPSPSNPCVHHLRVLCAVWQALAVDFFRAIYFI